MLALITRLFIALRLLKPSTPPPPTVAANPPPTDPPRHQD
jgi:hypothetical protein